MEGLFQEGMHLDSDGMCKVHAEILHEFLMDTVINSGISFYQNFFDVVKFLFHNLSSCHGNIVLPNINGALVR